MQEIEYKYTALLINLWIYKKISLICTQAI